MATTVLVTGLNHTTAPVEVREQALALCTREDLHAELKRQLDPALFPEHVFLSTCNRTEMYAVTTDAECGAHALSAAMMWNEFGNGLPREAIYLHAGRAAAEHLYAVAAGLDSLVLGEFEILGQVRRAYHTAAEEGTTGARLHQLFSSALRLGKRARAETDISSGVLSVAHAAIALARETLGTLNGRRVLIVGAGEMGRRAAEHLQQDKGAVVQIVNRTYEHAQELAHSTNATAIPYQDLPGALAESDMVIAATQAPHFILDAGTIARARTGQDALCIVDLAMPRNVDPAVAELANVRLFNLDDLDVVVSNTRAQRAQAIETVRGMIAEEADAFQEWEQARNAAPLIAELYARGEAIREAELDKTLRRLQHLPLTERDRNVIAALAAGVVNKLLAAPTSQLKVYAAHENAQQYLETARELFDLKVSESTDDVDNR